MKKMLSALLCITLLSANILAFASEPTSEQLAELYDYKIFQGDENGDLNLDNNITRAEFCKVILASLGYSDELRKFDEIGDFSDVDDTYWAYLYINNAKKLSLIDGYEDGSFLPEKDISLNEVIKIVVNALGYNPMAEEKGGYPDGYMTVAENLKLIQGSERSPEEAALRKDVANIIFAALDVPLMQITSFGDKTEYKIMDGTNDTSLTTLRLMIQGDEKAPATEGAEENTSDVPRFNGSEYTGRILKITDLQKNTNGYSFKNSLDDGDNATYVINDNTYVYISENTVELKDIKTDMYAQCWYLTDAPEDNVEILKIELMKKTPQGF